jgi:hypothetical protein
MLRELSLMKVEKMKIEFKGSTVHRLIHEAYVFQFAWVG